MHRRLLPKQIWRSGTWTPASCTAFSHPATLYLRQCERRRGSHHQERHLPVRLLSPLPFHPYSRHHRCCLLLSLLRARSQLQLRNKPSSRDIVLYSESVRFSCTVFQCKSISKRRFTEIVRLAFATHSKKIREFSRQSLHAQEYSGSVGARGARIAWHRGGILWFSVCFYALRFSQLIC
jgi:hypothetical protein